MIATGIDLLLAIIGFLDKPGFGSGWRWGAFVGLIAAVVAFFPFGKPMVDAFRNRKSTVEAGLRPACGADGPARRSTDRLGQVPAGTQAEQTE